MARKKIAYLGLLISLAFIFSYLEFLIPINLGVPGVKLGLANLVIIVALYTIGEKETFFLSVVRILLVGFYFWKSLYDDLQLCGWNGKLFSDDFDEESGCFYYKRS